MASAVSDGAECDLAKKLKLDENCDLTVHGDIKDLSEFKLDSILHNNTQRKVVCLRGKFENKQGEAVVILEKPAFAAENLAEDSKYFTEKNHLEKVFHNDVYGDYKYFPASELNTIKTTIIHPATEKHIAKYSIQNCYFLEETPEIYKEYILPNISPTEKDLQWVYNILEHKSEADRILVEDSDPKNGFVMVPDLKWNGEVETLYYLAIVNDRNLKSIRDLAAEHLPLLKNIKEKGVAAIKEKHGLDLSQLRIYLHYQPSFYHLHIHFTYLRHEGPGILAERAHLLTSVINNLEILHNFYEKATIPFVVREQDKYFPKLVEKRLLTKV